MYTYQDCAGVRGSTRPHCCTSDTKETRVYAHKSRLKHWAYEAELTPFVVQAAEAALWIAEARRCVHAWYNHVFVWGPRKLTTVRWLEHLYASVYAVPACIAPDVCV